MENIYVPLSLSPQIPPNKLSVFQEEEQGGLAVGTRETQAKGSEFKAYLSYKVNSGPA